MILMEQTLLEQLPLDFSRVETGPVAAAGGPLKRALGDGHTICYIEPCSFEFSSQLFLQLFSQLNHL